MKVIVTGSGGRLGAAVARHLRERHQVVAYDRKALDLREPPRIEDHLLGLEFDALINCAAVTSLEYCESHPQEAIAVNVDAPAFMARICHERGARMIHLSTNYVYDGTAPGRRDETDPVKPLSVYAGTKLEGERHVLAADDAHIVARTAWVFGPDRNSFVDQIIARARKEACGAVGDSFSSASYSSDLAALLERLLRREISGGIYNVSNSGGCSWRELGQCALDILTALGWKLRCRTLADQKLADMTTFVAARPGNTVMDIAKVSRVAGLTPRPWREALEDYLTTYYGRE